MRYLDPAKVQGLLNNCENVLAKAITGPNLDFGVAGCLMVGGENRAREYGGSGPLAN